MFMWMPFLGLVLVIIDCSLAAHQLSEQNSWVEDNGDIKSQNKRQVGDDLCYIPESLKNGNFFPHRLRCPAGDNSVACQLVPGTPVNAGWVIFYTCDLGYLLNSTRIASICLQKPGGARWLPSLPVCSGSSYTSRSLPSMNVCGKTPKHVLTKRSIDGKISTRGAWPWMVIFGHNKTNNPRDGIHWFCAGTLVTSRHVLTAANCVASHRRRPMFVARLDDLNLDESVKDGSMPIEVRVEKRNIIVNPGFHENVVFSQNIAVVKLKSHVTFTDYVRPICLPTPDFAERSFDGETAYFTSWGQTDDDHERNPKRKRRFEPILHELKAKVIDQEYCKFTYRDYQTTDTPIVINDKIICASVEVNKSCQGDVGSPLMLKYKENFFIIGIVATEYRCFDDAFPRLFTKLSKYMNWIVTNLDF